MIFESVSSLSKIEADIASSTASIIEHLIKLYYFRDDQASYSWKRSIYSALNSLPKCKSDNKYPDFGLIHSSFDFTIFDAVYESTMSEIQNWDSLARYIEDVLSHQNKNDIWLLWLEYSKKLALSLAGRGSVSLNEIISILDSLLNRFIYM
jgi:hypothetical protein